MFFVFSAFITSACLAASRDFSTLNTSHTVQDVKKEFGEPDYQLTYYKDGINKTALAYNLSDSSSQAIDFKDGRLISSEGTPFYFYKDSNGEQFVKSYGNSQKVSDVVDSETMEKAFQDEDKTLQKKPVTNFGASSKSKQLNEIQASAKETSKRPYYVRKNQEKRAGTKPIVVDSVRSTSGQKGKPHTNSLAPVGGAVKSIVSLPFKILGRYAEYYTSPEGVRTLGHAVSALGGGTQGTQQPLYQPIQYQPAPYQPSSLNTNTSNNYIPSAPTVSMPRYNSQQPSQADYGYHYNKNGTGYYRDDSNDGNLYNNANYIGLNDSPPKYNGGSNRKTARIGQRGGY